MKLSYRETVIPSDREAVRIIVESSEFFSPEETSIAVELVDERLSKGIESGYRFLFCEDKNREVLGYTCFGPIPGTEESFDLYWIAVRRDFKGKGIGRELIGVTEKIIADMGGKRVYIETSSRDLYKPTQAFYLGSGYTREAVIQDFYSPGDSKLIYVKVLGMV